MIVNQMFCSTVFLALRFKIVADCFESGAILVGPVDTGQVALQLAALGERPAAERTQIRTLPWNSFSDCVVYRCIHLYSTWYRSIAHLCVSVYEPPASASACRPFHIDCMRMVGLRCELSENKSILGMHTKEEQRSSARTHQMSLVRGEPPQQSLAAVNAQVADFMTARGWIAMMWWRRG